MGVKIKPLKILVFIIIQVITWQNIVEKRLSETVK